MQLRRGQAQTEAHGQIDGEEDEQVVEGRLGLVGPGAPARDPRRSVVVGLCGDACPGQERPPTLDESAAFGAFGRRGALGARILRVTGTTGMSQSGLD